ncbi:MAG TPA: hypothetical protein VGO58_00175 [Chitinophagaceae bacterium]|jgi:hypothetical protein|nr:hypothetical protein [Chitinophagaceae bacterium]
MKKYLLFIVLAVMTACKSNDKSSVKHAGHDSDYSFGPLKDTIPVNQTFTDADFDMFGDIRIGQHYMEVIRILGVPARKTNPVQWDADGLDHEAWDYKTQGLVINMSSDKLNADKTRSVFSITAREACPFKTTRNISIGSSYAEVTEAYKNAIDQSSTDTTMITVGSVYGGIIFSFKNNKVETIFFGSAAE